MGSQRVKLLMTKIVLIIGWLDINFVFLNGVANGAYCTIESGFLRYFCLIQVIFLYGFWSLILLLIVCTAIFVWKTGWRNNKFLIALIPITFGFLFFLAGLR